MPTDSVVSAPVRYNTGRDGRNGEREADPRKYNWPDSEFAESKVQRRKRRHKAIGQWFSGVNKGTIRVEKSMGEDSGAGGGFLVPFELQLAVDEYLAERSVFHALAFLAEMTTGPSLHLPGMSMTTAHATGQSGLFGGMQLAWIAPAQQGATGTSSEQEPQFQDVVLNARDLFGYANIGCSLMDDGGPVLGAYMENLVQRAVLFATEQQFFQGLGTTTPLGITQSPGTKKVGRHSGSTIVQLDVANMVAALHPACFATAIFCCSPTALAQIVQLTSYFPNAGPLDSLCGYLMGKPLYVTEHLPSMGTYGDLCLFDPALYCVGRRGIFINWSPHVLFSSRQIQLRVNARYDGQPFANGLLTAANGDSVATMVALN
jgi:HK97 family phage major capsid protein